MIGTTPALRGVNNGVLPSTYTRNTESKCVFGKDDNPMFERESLGHTTLAQCQSCCDNTAGRVAFHGRRFQTQTLPGIASCSLAWGCDSVEDWSDGDTHQSQSAIDGVGDKSYRVRVLR